jgi:hypothetical protein
MGSRAKNIAYREKDPGEAANSQKPNNQCGFICGLNRAIQQASWPICLQASPSLALRSKASPTAALALRG